MTEGAATFTLRDAAPADAPVLLALVRELAVFERLAHRCVSDEKALAAALERNLLRAIIAERRDDAGPVPIGMAIWHETFSTFSGRHGFWLEDLFVLPDQRRLGVGRALFAELARRVKAEGGTGLGWRVLRWNEPGLRFYRACGGAPNAEWQEMTLTGAALEKLAGG